MTGKVNKRNTHTKLSQRAPEKIDALNTRAKELQYNPEPEGQQIAEEALALAEKEQYQKGIAEALITLGWRAYQKGSFALILEQSERALAIAEAIDETAIEGRACNTIGGMYFSTGNYSKALEYYMRSLAICEKIGNRQGIGASLGNIGLVYDNTGDYSRALEYHMRSLAIAEETGNKRGIAGSLGNIGNVYYSTADYSKALEYQTRSLSIDEEIGDKRAIANSLQNIGNIYQSIDDFKKAIEYQMRSLNIFKEIGDKQGISSIFMGIGNAYMGLEDFSKAIEYNKQSLTINKEIDSKYGIALALFNIGVAYAAKENSERDIEKSIEYFRKSVSLFEEIGAKDRIFKTHQALAEVYEQTKDWENFAIHHKKYHEIEKEVFNEETTKKIQNLETQQKFAEIEKEREIEKREQKATYKILNKIFPRSVVDRLRDGESPLADYYPEATILFLDLVDFTTMSSRIPARQLLYLLNSIFAACDKVIAEHGLEKIKTIGDAYMAASGVPEPDPNHLENAARAALRLLKALKELVITIPQEIEGDRTWMTEMDGGKVRIGIHTGEVIGGVIGESKYAYDLWGDTVNIAARMESTGEPDKIHVSEVVFTALQDKFVFQKRRAKSIKGKGKMQTYFLIGERT